MNWDRKIGIKRKTEREKDNIHCTFEGKCNELDS